ncbi:MAG TPA: hypothetical protein VNF68_11455 [Candidatus Baltobacteraceae bacterium]|nr:hypothetical protein [Candidatus Baltobacteraceae bacterium]
MLKSIVELDRLVSATPEPHSVAVRGKDVWIASRATRRIDVMERERWKKVEEIEPPGMPWGMTYGGGAVVMTCGEGDEDHRRVHRYIPSEGFEKHVVECPEDTGSHLALYGGRVLLGQWYNKKLLLLDHDGSVTRSYDAPHGIAGVAVIDDMACVLGTDDEDHGEYWISRVDLRAGTSGDLATVPFHARGLAWDGSRFWTNHREADRIVTFTLPG